MSAPLPPPARRKRALICGASGQDGAYLARLLLAKGYTVFGSSRDASLNSFSNLSRLGIKEQVTFVSISLNDFRSVYQALHRIEPDEIYNLAGQSSVGLSFEQPVETMDSIALASLNVLEVMRLAGVRARLYNACSSECFGETGDRAADEDATFRPRSPYAVAKSAAFWQVANYREAYGLFASSGILFNHESPLRPERFVTQKIIAAARRIASGSNEKLALGNIEIQRDWGWAPEYVDAMWRMLQLDRAEDFVIATGETRSLREFVSAAFSAFGLNWEKHVTTDPTLYRPSDLRAARANPGRALQRLEWKARRRMEDVIQGMVNEDHST